MLRRSRRDAGSAPAPTPPDNRGEFDFALELCAAEGLTGWVVHPSGAFSVRVRHGDRVVAEAAVGLPRPDIARLHDGVPRAGEAGFSLRLPESWPAAEAVEVELVALDGTKQSFGARIWPAWPGGGLASTTPEAAATPLPSDVAAALLALRPDAYKAGAAWDAATVQGAVTDVVEILANRAQVEPVLRWAHFLRTMHAAFEFVSGHFPRFNTRADAGAKDAAAIGTSADEMLAVANHLYVLRAAGVAGALVECGCFKGFSTCCLSQACVWLGIPMHTFDSFAGLPPSDGDYYGTGEFCGSLAEVTANVQTFGRPEVVSLHEGFFSDTLPGWRDPVLSVFMDVDLESSAGDVMQLMPLLDRRSAVFSHEIPADTFDDGSPRRDASEVVPPILDGFAARGGDVRGRHAGGLLGAFWESGAGIPVIDPVDLAAVVAAARRP